MNGLDRVEAGYDVVVVGARAAGAATAMLLARRGLRVLAVDRGAYGTDTLSTHALMRAGVFQLAAWGLLERIEAADTPRVRRTVFHYEDEVIDIPIKPRDGVPGLFAPRRTVLDRVLVDAAVEAGADVRHRVRLADLAPRPRRACGGCRPAGRGRRRKDRARRDRDRRRRPALDGRVPGGGARDAPGPTRRRQHLRVLVGPRRGRLPLALGPGHRGRRHPHERRRGPGLRGSVRAEVRRRGAGGRLPGLPAHPRGGRARARGEARAGAARGIPPRLPRSPGVPPPPVGNGLGSRRRRRLLQGPDHRPRHQRRAPRRGAPRKGGGGGHGRGPGRLRGRAGRALHGALRRDRPDRVRRVEHGRAEGPPPGPQRRDEARGGGARRPARTRQPGPIGRRPDRGRRHGNERVDA